MISIRTAVRADSPRLWALNNLPNVGHTADGTAPLDLPVPDTPPTSFPDLEDVTGSFLAIGGDFVVGEMVGHLVGMGGFKPTSGSTAQVLRVRVHPATRRRGVGRQIMLDLERRAFALGLRAFHLDTADNQPDAMAFYEALGYDQVGTERQPGWSWTLVYYRKRLSSAE